MPPDNDAPPPPPGYQIIPPPPAGYSMIPPGASEGSAPQAPAQPQESGLTSFAKGIGAGGANMVFGAEQLAGKGLSKIGFPQTGKKLTDQAELAQLAITAATAPSYAQHGTATTAGDFIGGMIGPGRIAKSIEEGLGIGKGAQLATKAVTKGPMQAAAATAKGAAPAAVAGAAAGAVTPVDPTQNFWTQKALQVAMGGGVGAGFGGAGAAMEVASARAATKAAGKLTPSVDMLLQAGVRLTPGQLGGRVARGYEQAAKSTPIIRDVVHNAEQTALSDFQKATVNKALASLGATVPKEAPTGNRLIEWASDQVHHAYQTILPKMAYNPDRQVAEDIMRLKQTTNYKLLPAEEQRQFDTFISENMQKRVVPGGSPGGDTIQAIDRDLGSEAASNRKSQNPNQQKLGELYRDLQEAFRDNVERINPAFAPELAKARRAAALMMRVEKAAGRPAALGHFTPGDLLGAIKSMDTSSRRAAFSRGGDDFQKWAAAGQERLGSTVPDSGTAFRSHMTIPDALKGALLSGPYAAVAAGSRAALRHPGVVKRATGQVLRTGALPGAVASEQGQ